MVKDRNKPRLFYGWWIVLAAATANATTTAGAYDFDKAYIYDGSTLIASAPVVGTTVTFTNDNGLFTVPNAGSKIITVKADVMGLATGAISGDSPVLYLADNQNTTQLQSDGVSSNASTSATDGSPNPETYTNFGAQWLYKTIITVNKNSASPSGAATAGAGAEVLRFDVTADAAADAYVSAVAIQNSGTADLSAAASGSANLYKSTDLTNALATEAVVGPVTLVGGGAAVTSVTTTAGGWDGIPIGATVHINDAAAGTTWRTAVVSYISPDVADVAIMYFTAAVNADITDTITYQPMQPGSGKTYFGGLTQLAADTGTSTDPTSYEALSITVDSTKGFAVGDTVIVTGYSPSGVATTSASMTVATTTASVLTFTATLKVAIDYNYGITYSETDAKYSRAIVYTNNTGNFVGTVGTGEAVAAGTTKTFVVKGDTTGAASTKTIRADIAAIGDLVWDDGQQTFINTRAKNLPIIGGTLTY